MNIGIDALQMYIPKLVLPIEELAKARSIDPAKLQKGLGLEAMRLMDVDEDVVSMGTAAVFRLLKQEQLDLKDIDRLYVGTESSIDNSKPVASYILQNILQKQGENKAVRCDAVDFTFACIGAVDAVQNCLDYIQLNPNKKAIVVATDFAKYELNSTGEYTQGAGAFALLLGANPRLLAIDSKMGVSTKGVFDFFKPKVYETIDANAFSGKMPVVRDEPVFDGQYSNQCYIEQITDAYKDFKALHPKFENANQWDLICMHLPYCFQGRRTFIELFAEEHPELLNQAEGENRKEKLKSLSKSPTYKDFVSKRIAPSEYLSAKVGNCYTGSIFLGLVSSLLQLKNSGAKAKHIGFIAYGSGSKSKVFSGELVDGWEQHIDTAAIEQEFEDLTEIDFKTYELLHLNQLQAPLSQHPFALKDIEKDNPVLRGARTYELGD